MNKDDDRPVFHAKTLGEQLAMTDDEKRRYKQALARAEKTGARIVTPSIEAEDEAYARWKANRGPETRLGGVPVSANPKPGTDKGAGIGCLAIVVIVIIFVIIGSISGSGDDDKGGGSAASGASASPDPEEQAYAAFSVCTDFVSERLKAPSTASFRNFFEHDGEVSVTGTGSGPYTVRSSVDSENSFGASIRTFFTCVVRNTSGDRWQLQSLVFDE